MEIFVTHLLHAALWMFFLIFALAIVGAIAIIKWIADLFRTTESAVESGVQTVQRTIHRK
jgi:hypothetical protein